MIYDLGMVDKLYLGYMATDHYMRHRAGQENHPGATQQREMAERIVEEDKQRTGSVLANDNDLYNCLEALSIMTKGCQDCATLPDAWHNRGCMFGCDIKK